MRKGTKGGTRGYNPGSAPLWSGSRRTSPAGRQSSGKGGGSRRGGSLSPSARQSPRQRTDPGVDTVPPGRQQIRKYLGKKAGPKITIVRQCDCDFVNNRVDASQPLQNLLSACRGLYHASTEADFVPLEDSGVGANSPHCLGKREALLRYAYGRLHTLPAELLPCDSIQWAAILQ